MLAAGAQDTLKFLLGLLDRFPRFAARPLYIAGESYGGHYVPTLAAAIVTYGRAARTQGAQGSDATSINLKVPRPMWLRAA